MLSPRIFPPPRAATAGLTLLLLALAGVAPPAGAAEPPPDTLPAARHVASAGAADAILLLAARRYAAFWNTGDERFATAALAPGFTDRTLPPGRPQGVEGPLQASRAFRAAVPDLTATVEDMVAAGDRVAVHYRFQGHFTGRFGDARGQGQTVDFQAFDLYRVQDGRITDNWHLEDNLTLLRQFGLIAP